MRNILLSDSNTLPNTKKALADIGLTTDPINFIAKLLGVEYNIQKDIYTIFVCYDEAITDIAN